jgi:hypothetical protein
MTVISPWVASDGINMVDGKTLVLPGKVVSQVLMVLCPLESIVVSSIQVSLGAQVFVPWTTVAIGVLPAAISCKVVVAAGLNISPDGLSAPREPTNVEETSGLTVIISGAMVWSITR